MLVVEDDEGVREVLGDLFRSEGFQVSLATGGAEMRPILAQRDVDLCVIDVHLPGRDNGLVLANEAAGFGCGIVLMTGDTTILQKVGRSGHRFLVKPFALHRLLRTIDRALRDVTGNLAD